MAKKTKTTSAPVFDYTRALALFEHDGPPAQAALDVDGPPHKHHGWFNPGRKIRLVNGKPYLGGRDENTQFFSVPPVEGQEDLPRWMVRLREGTGDRDLRVQLYAEVGDDGADAVYMRYPRVKLYKDWSQPFLGWISLEQIEQAGSHVDEKMGEIRGGRWDPKNQRPRYTSKLRLNVNVRPFFASRFILSAGTEHEVKVVYKRLFGIRALDREDDRFKIAPAGAEWERENSFPITMLDPKGVPLPHGSSAAA